MYFSQPRPINQGERRKEANNVIRYLPDKIGFDGRSCLGEGLSGCTYFELCRGTVAAAALQVRQANICRKLDDINLTVVSQESRG